MNAEKEKLGAGLHSAQSVGAYFGLLGVVVGVWVARIPEIQAKLILDDGQLGGVLLMSAVGALVAMPLTGRLAAWFGTKGVAWVAAGWICVLLPLIALAPTRLALMAVFGAFGSATGIYGVVINAMAVEVEAQLSRPILSTFHGLFSLGGLIGALIAAGCMAANLGPVESLAGAAVGVALAYLIAGVGLPEGVIHPRPQSMRDGGKRRWSLPHRRLILLGGLAFLGLVGEGSMGDWSAVYLRRSLGASRAVAGLGYAAYALGMTAGRFSGDFLSRRLGDRTLLRWGAGLASLGLFLAITTGSASGAIVGFVLVGAGLANAVPVLYRSAAATPGVDPVAGIATTSTVGYLGFLAGPPLIGQVAHQTTLGVALGVVAAAIGGIAIGGSLLLSKRSKVV